MTEVKNYEDRAATSSGVTVPLKDDGSEYTIDGLYPDQRDIVAVVIDKLYEFMESDDLSSFRPLRIILNGAGGSGKSVVINTIVTVIRKMFDSDDVVKVAAPTGTAAFNVSGETFHHMLGNRVSRLAYLPNSMSASKRLKLIKKFKCLLAVIVDERSLVSNSVLGTAARQICETIFDGGPLREDIWGGLPIVILAGDDFQLPSQEEGPLNVLSSTAPKNRMISTGRNALLECAENVYDLQGSKRIKDSNNDDKDLIAQLRVATESGVEDKHVERLMNLHIDNIKRVHGETFVSEIESKAIFLFYQNEKRIRHNVEQLAKQQSSANPVALMKCQSTSNTYGKGVASHFDSKSPKSVMLCKGSKVAIDNKNFCPQWGLHNGACGMVDEIVFSPGENPNHGDLPSYVVVEFPLYCGPAWDKDNPKVSLCRLEIKLPTFFTTSPFR